MVRLLKSIEVKAAILSDIHANLQAFEACLRDAEAMKADLLLSTGDIVGYGPNPEEVVSLARSVGLKSVMGNHDYAINNIAAEKYFNPHVQPALAITRRLLSDASLDFLAKLPPNMEKAGVFLVHGFPPASFKTYLFMVPSRGIARVLSSMKQDIIVVGHTHELVHYKLSRGKEIVSLPLGKGKVFLEPDAKHLINAGSVGQPRDGDYRAKYLLWDSGSRELEVRFCEYPVEDVVRKILELGLPETYAQRLFARNR